MSIDWAYFTKNIERAGTGSGYVETIPVEFFHFRLTTGGPLTTSGNQKVGLYPTNTYTPAAILTESTTGSMTLTLTIPGDYDDSSDELKLALVQANGGAGTISVSVEAYYRKRTALESAGVAGTDYQIETVAFTDIVATEAVVDFSDLGLAPGDNITVKFQRNNSLAQPWYVYGGEWRYRSNLAMTDKSKR